MAEKKLKNILAGYINTGQSQALKQTFIAAFLETYHSEDYNLGSLRVSPRKVLLYPPKLIELVVRLIPRLLLGVLALLLQPNNSDNPWAKFRKGVFNLLGGIILAPFALLKELILPFTSPINHVLKPLIIQFRGGNKRPFALSLVLLGTVLLAGLATAVIFGGVLGITLPAVIASLPVVGGLLLAAGNLPLWAGVLIVVGVGYLGMAISHRMSFGERARPQGVMGENFALQVTDTEVDSSKAFDKASSRSLYDPGVGDVPLKTLVRGSKEGFEAAIKGSNEAGGGPTPDL